MELRRAVHTIGDEELAELELVEQGTDWVAPRTWLRVEPNGTTPPGQ
ncbi:hypothetical protein [Streptomyces capitiformicae]|nr:hypothetical protein [Streptomyces capitiformicae]